MRAKQLSQSAFIQDLALLARFDLTNLELGIKLHQDSDPELRESAQRLFQKGVITEADGGYLTPFGVSLLEYLDHLLNALTVAD
jgi:uncharacterized protein (TIGR02647 family)